MRDEALRLIQAEGSRVGGPGRESDPERAHLRCVGHHRVDESAADAKAPRMRGDEQIIEHDHDTERQ